MEKIRGQQQKLTGLMVNSQIFFPINNDSCAARNIVRMKDVTLQIKCIISFYIVPWSNHYLQTWKICQTLQKRKSFFKLTGWTFYEKINKLQFFWKNLTGYSFFGQNLTGYRFFHPPPPPIGTLCYVCCTVLYCDMYRASQ